MAGECSAWHCANPLSLRRAPFLAEGQVPVPGGGSNENDQFRRGNRGNRRSVKAGTPSASSPEAMVSRWRGAPTASPSSPRVSDASTSFAGALAERRGGDQDVGGAPHRASSSSAPDQLVDQTRAQRRRRVEQLAAVEQVLGRGRADEVQQHLDRGGGWTTPTLAGVTPKTAVSSAKRRSQQVATSRPPPTQRPRIAATVGTGNARRAAWAARSSRRRSAMGTSGSHRPAGRSCPRRRRSSAPPR